MRTLRQDVLYALRQMRLSPVFTLTAMLTLALGIGATTAIFSLIDSVMMKSLPVADPGRLYRVGAGMNCCGQIGPQKEWGLFPYTLYQRIAAAAPEFEQTAAFESWFSSFSVRRAESKEPAKPLRSEYVSGNYFATFGVNAYAGRTLLQSDDQPSAAPAAMLSHRVWQQEYGSDPKVVGSAFLIDGHPFTIVGITPPGFFGETLRSDPPEIFVPLQQEPMLAGQNTTLKTPLAWLRIIGRLKPDAKTDGMAARFTTITRDWLLSELGAEYPQYLDQLKKVLPTEIVNIVPAGGGVAEMKAGYQSSLRILMVVCGQVLLIACANLANLFLARGSARGTQAAVRLAMGATKTRLVRQSLTESLVLAVLGGAAGIFIAFAGVKLIVALAFHSAHFVPIDAKPSLAVLGFAFGMALVTGLLFGTAPAWFASRTNPALVLHGAGRSTRDGRALPQKALVVVQATLSVVLLTGAGLLTRSLMKMEHQNFGFETDHRVSLRVNAPFSSYSPEKLDATYRALRQRLEQIPGVQHVAMGMYSPFTNNWDAMIARQGQGKVDVNGDNASSWDRVSAGYLETMGQRILRGRSITEQDTASTPNVAVVDEAFVKKFFKPGEEPLGTHFGMNDEQYSGMYEIVGVVRTANYTDPSGHWRMPLLFVPLAQRGHYNTAMSQMIEDRSHLIESVVLELHGSMQGLEPQVRRAFAEVDSNLTLISMRTMEQQVADRMEQERSVSQLTGLFGILALVLAAVGLYGVTAYGVERRTGEIGVRIALGANRAQVVAMVLRGAFVQILIGLLIGIPVSIGCARLIASQLYEVKGWDPMALGGSIAALALCALVASLVPARRAAAINPVRALRVE
ncbi:ABC transporter permease [Telmatobacter sp. DSM 110680]|uniref:ABC transporter permease n=1 Tax=Telmatobacter sp. DSM 110680 TaxID=3036704 RepID=A0AAU7DI72_9BACT